MIEVRGLKKTFDGFAALDGADLSVPRGAVYGLVGPNGAGKTTLLRHLTGVYHQDSGSVTFDGQPAPTAANFCWRALPFGRTPTPSGAWW